MNNSIGLFKNCIFKMDKYENLTEQELIENIRQGDDLAEEYLYFRYSYIVKKIVSSFFIIGGDKDDLFQEAMIGLMHAVDKYNFEINNNFKYFAELCIRRQIITAIRKSKGYKKNLLNNSISIYECVNEEFEDNLLCRLENNDCRNPESVLIIKEEISYYREIKSSVLSQFEMEVLSEFENEKTYEEISVSLKKDVKSIDNALQRIRKKINENREKSLNAK